MLGLPGIHAWPLSNQSSASSPRDMNATEQEWIFPGDQTIIRTVMLRTPALDRITKRDPLSERPLGAAATIAAHPHLGE